VKPGAVESQAPHIAVQVFARGLLKQVFTRAYFPDEERANAADPVLSAVEDADDRATLVAVPEDGALRFDIRLQGGRQTVFFGLLPACSAPSSPPGRGALPSPTGRGCRRCSMRSGRSRSSKPGSA